MNNQMVRTSPVGMIPQQWPITVLKNIASVEYGISDPLDKSLHEGIRIIGLHNVSKEGIYSDYPQLYVRAEQTKVDSPLNQNDILFCWRSGSREHIGKTYLYRLNGLHTHVGFLLRIRSICSKVNPLYLDAYLKYLRARGYFLGAKIQVNSTFNKGELLELPVVVPPLAKQRKIAEILNTWDEAIATVQQLIDALKRRKQGLMQRLLTGEVRFPEFEGEAWEEKAIGEVLEEIRRPVKDFSADREYHFLSVRRRSQGLFFRETQAGDHLEGKGMFEVKTGDFLISKRQIVHGASGLTDENHDGYVVSNSYHALVPREKDKFDIRFFDWLSRTPYLYHLSHVASHGVHIEKLFFTLGTYFRRKIKVPPTLGEQQKIIEVLDSFDQTISSYEMYKQKLTVQKKGIMQRLLTGQVRVQVGK